MKNLFSSNFEYLDTDSNELKKNKGHLELVGHLAERLQRVLLGGLFEAEGLGRLGHLLGHAARTAPVAHGDLGQRRQQAERVVAAIANENGTSFTNRPTAKFIRNDFRERSVLDSKTILLENRSQ